MKKLLSSLPTAVLLVLLIGLVGAYRAISQRQRVNSRAAEIKLRQDVSNTISDLKISLPPLSEAASERNDSR